MSHTMFCVYVHIVFAVKKRKRYFKELAERQAIHAYLAEVARREGSPYVLVGGHCDHVHMLVALTPSLCCAHLMQEVKRNSSSWIKKNQRDALRFSWQAGYAAFSISPKELPKVRHYIEHQEEHHTDMNFEQEIMGFAEMLKGEIDPRKIKEFLCDD